MHISNFRSYGLITASTVRLVRTCLSTKCIIGPFTVPRLCGQHRGCCNISWQVCRNKYHAKELIVLKQIQVFKKKKGIKIPSQIKYTTCQMTCLLEKKSHNSLRASINKHDSWKNWQSCETTASRLYLDTTVRRLYFNTRPLKRTLHLLYCSPISALFIGGGKKCH